MIKKLVRWVYNTPLLLRFREFIGLFLLDARILILVYPDSQTCDVLDIIKKIRNERRVLLRGVEAFYLFMAVKNTMKVKGDIAEVGVCNGSSAKLICEAKDSKPLHLFDTFEGIPKVDEIDSDIFHIGQYKATIENVKSYLAGYENIYFYKGIFPETAGPIKDKKFSFVHLDVDTYESTLNCLNFFYPRMSNGGVIISHDYQSSAGVTKAFGEFFADKPEPLIEMLSRQCLVVKT